MSNVLYTASHRFICPVAMASKEQLEKAGVKLPALDGQIDKFEIWVAQEFNPVILSPDEAHLAPKLRKLGIPCEIAVTSLAV